MTHTKSTYFNFKACITLVYFLALVGCDQGVNIDQASQVSAADPTLSVDQPKADSSMCATASEHVQACTGTNITALTDGCDPLDAELLLETPCEVLTAAADVPIDQKADSGESIPFTCLFLGIGCPVDRSCYIPLSEESEQRVIELSNPNNLIDEYDVRSRIEEIAAIFKEEKDPRGIFSIVYRLITNNAVESVEEGLYEHPEWTKKLIVAFARRYLVNLHGHLTGGKVSVQWKKYYKLAQDCSVGYGRTLGVAIATHLMVDLAYALDDVDSLDIHEEDFVLFGEVSLRIFPNLIADMYTVYETDVSDLLKGFFFGDWVDSIYTKGTATTFIYQTVRINAWRNSRNMLSFPAWVVYSDISAQWGLSEVFLATLDASGVL